MDRGDLEPLATEVLIPAYLDAVAYSANFRDQHSFPPTLLARIHHMRSVAQALIIDVDRFHLDPQYAEYGKVQVVDDVLERRFLLRSKGALAIEEAKVPTLFELPYISSDVTLLIQNFTEEGMHLAVVGTWRRKDKQRLEASGPPTFVGTWPYTSDDTPAPFDQGSTDWFDEIGEMPDEDEGQRA